MKFGSLFSGIGAPEVAWTPLGWQCAWVAEIHPFASAVLAARFPGVPNLGDVTEIDPDAVEPVDLVAFGSPCQSFSVAGKRLGLDDPRGNMALVALRLVGKLRPRWLVFENVPGLLSSDGGRDFGAFLGLLGECGFGYAYRVLDAQHFGVPQRRRRVFVVGCLGDWRSAAAVLFEPESLRGDTAPRREAGERIALPVTSRVDRGGEHREAHGNNLIAFGGNNTAGEIDVATAVNAHGGPHGRLDFESETFIAHQGFPDPAYALSAGKQDDGGVFGSGRDGQDTFVAHSLSADGFDASEDGTGRGTPIVATPIQDVRGHRDKKQNGIGIGVPGDPSYTLSARDAHAVAFDTTQISSPGNYSAPKPGDPCHPLAVGQHAPAVAGTGMTVRRLTPRECERLQGLPDDWTAITYRGKPAADGPRYRAVGNSMAVPVLRWIGERIEAVPPTGLVTDRTGSNTDPLFEIT